MLSGVSLALCLMSHQRCVGVGVTFVVGRDPVQLLDAITTTFPGEASMLSCTSKPGKKPRKNKPPPADTLGAPRVLVLCMSAIRAVDVIRSLHALNPVGKLFGKHKQLGSQIEYVKSTPFNVAVGTPARVLKLLSERALRLDRVQLCVLDATYVDAKQRTLLEQPETLQSLRTFLTEHAAPRCRAHSMRVLLH
eukprot:m.609405 g.609405  ORF g.609405 m.609405 type:complete len:193 (+) comp22489_c0_seq1:808-1386(+)